MWNTSIANVNGLSPQPIQYLKFIFFIALIAMLNGMALNSDNIQNNYANTKIRTKYIYFKLESFKTLLSGSLRFPLIICDL